MELLNELETTEDSVLLSKEEYAKLKEKAKQAEELLDKYLRLQADFDNYKKFMDRQKATYLNYGNERILKELIKLYDDLKRAINAHDPKSDKGLILILNKFSALLRNEGIEPIEAEGKKFNPDLHECMMVEQNPSLEDEVNTEVLEEGYKLKGKVLRPSKVKVNKLNGDGKNGS
jgi:molecular chaperone GrpE